MKHFALFLALATSLTAAADDLIVLSNGDVIKGQVHKVGTTEIEYRKAENPTGPLYTVEKSEILSIVYENGVKETFSDTTAPNTASTNASASVAKQSTADPHPYGLCTENPHKHPAVTYSAIEPDFVEIKAKANGKKDLYKYILIEDDKGQTLNMRLLSATDKTLSVARARKGDDYKKRIKDLTIPEYVMVGDAKYTVTEIDDHAFDIGAPRIGGLYNLILPETLKSIGDCSFLWNLNLTEIVLPESIEKIGSRAFQSSGQNIHFSQLYIPKGVKLMSDSFGYIGTYMSYRGYYQGNLTCVPDFVTLSNCTNYGIDEEALESYYERLNRR